MRDVPANSKKIIHYQPPFDLNIGAVIFLVVFVYLAIAVFQYVSREQIRIYEVCTGTISSQSEYTGIILRDETVTTATSAGFVNFYQRETDRTAVGELVYTMDETGKINQLLSEMDVGNGIISEDNLTRLKSQLIGYSTSYDPMAFDDVYSIRTNLQSTLLEILNSNLLSEVGDQLQEQNIVFTRNYAETSGILEFYTDGYEEMRAADLTSNIFRRMSWSRTVVSPNKMLEIGAPVYKTIHADDWYIYIPITDEDKQRFAGRSIVQVTFPGTGLTANAEYQLIIGADGSAFAELHLYKYMVRFAGERFVTVVLNDNVVEGYKIPISSVTTKSFYTIPKDYLTKGGDSQEDGYLREVYSPSGVSVEFVPVTIYYSTNAYDYADTNALVEGSVLVKPNSTEHFQVGPTASLEGAYNVNKGYAVFRLVEKVYQTDDFYIIRKGTPYGLYEHDRIVSNPSLVEESQIVY
ncbi:MAG: hypothetical protein IKQ96_03885 [Lachnospiraceae bacterium]|nr:hypothetical protein [Lachnospiraceae bacterium]